MDAIDREKLPIRFDALNHRFLCADGERIGCDRIAAFINAQPSLPAGGVTREQVLACVGKLRLVRPLSAHPTGCPADFVNGGYHVAIADAELHLAALYTLPAPAAEPAAEVANRPRIVCLCGSTRFYEQFQRANYEETMAGRIVLSVGFYMHSPEAHHGQDFGCTPHQKAALDELHLRKIDLADEVLILNVGGYIGESTSRELAYAKQQGKVIRYLEVNAPVKTNREVRDAMPASPSPSEGGDVEPQARRVVFQFDERSFDTIEDLESQGFLFTHVLLAGPDGEVRTLVLPGRRVSPSPCDKCKGREAEALEFLRRAATETGRIVSSGDLLAIQIVEAQATGRFFVDKGTSLGFALLPWDLTTDKDKDRERRLIENTPWRSIAERSESQNADLTAQLAASSHRANVANIEKSAMAGRLAEAEREIYDAMSTLVRFRHCDSDTLSTVAEIAADAYVMQSEGYANKAAESARLARELKEAGERWDELLAYHHRWHGQWLNAPMTSLEKMQSLASPSDSGPEGAGAGK